MRTFFRLAFSSAMIVGLGLAHADVVAVVSAKSNVTDLTKDQVSDIFLARPRPFRRVAKRCRSTRPAIRRSATSSTPR